MRVLLIGDGAGNPDEGMKHISGRLYEYLSATDGVEVRLITPLHVSRTFPSIRDWGPDVIQYVHGPSTASVILGFLVRAYCRRARLVVSLTHPVLNTLGEMLLVACNPDRLLAASASWQKWCTNHHLPVAFLPLSGVELDRFRPVGPKIKLELRKKLGFSDRTVILHVGHLRHRRNLAAMKEITKDRSKQVVIVISSALRSDANITEDLQSAGCVVRCGYVPHIEEYYQAADCYVFPTLDPEAAVSVPLSVLEAMATNIPVVTTPFGGLRDLFQSTPGLEFVPSDAMAELPAAVDRVLSIPHVNLRDRVQPHDWNAIGARLVRELRAVVS